MEILIKAAQLITSLAILVTLHEFGHFIPAKLFKTRVEKFFPMETREWREEKILVQ
jgi:regulator of sigma E protease